MFKHILIVDDSGSFRTVIKLALERAGYRVTEACDGIDASKKLTGQHIDLILCDIYMPNMDGPTFLKQIKANPSYALTPVLMVTTDRPESRQDVDWRSIARGWITKPFKPQQLIEAVQKLCPLTDATP